MTDEIGGREIGNVIWIDEARITNPPGEMLRGTVEEALRCRCVA